jgi:hypothetical protein
MTLDVVTAEMIAKRIERECVSPYMFSTTASPPNPDRIGWWRQRARTLADVDK